MDPKYIWIGVGVVALLIIVYLVLTANFRKKRKFFARILSHYGVTPDREYTVEEIRKIRTYFDLVHEEKDFAIDDITWNDLNMDDIFAVLNHTYSSMGEEELYRMLREPAQDEETLRKRSKLIDYFRSHEQERAEVLIEYAGIGRTKKYSLLEHITKLNDLKLRENIGYLLHLLLLIVAALSTIFNPFIGIIAVLGVIIFNLFTYYSQKAQVEAYYTSLSAVAYIVKAAERIEKLNVPALKPYMEELETYVKPLRVLKSDARFLGASNAAQVSANPLYLILDYLRMATHLDFIAFNHMVKTVRKEDANIKEVLRILGRIEALIGIASFRETLPFYCEAEFTDKKVFSLTDSYHPLIKEPVANSVHTEKSMLVTGSNASGKSTFLRTAAISQILAASVCTVPAHAMKTGFSRVFSSMALQDSVSAGESYYIVEIKSIKRIMDALREETPVLAFVDEVLRGTNTVERISASSQILKSFGDKNAIVFAATHDVELTYLLENLYTNIHFEEEVEGDKVNFSYMLKEGRATTRNAIKLLQVMGYDPAVIEKAEASAEHFTKEGEWTLF